MFNVIYRLNSLDSLENHSELRTRINLIINQITVLNTSQLTSSS